MNQTDAAQTITPYFTVKDADQFIAFAKSVFAAELIKENHYETNRIQHARLSIEGSVIMLNEATQTYPPISSQMHIYVKDADRIYAKALQNDATSLMAPNTRPHRDPMAVIKDPSGNIW